MRLSKVVRGERQLSPPHGIVLVGHDHRDLASRERGEGKETTDRAKTITWLHLGVEVGDGGGVYASRRCDTGDRVIVVALYTACRNSMATMIN